MSSSIYGGPDGGRYGTPLPRKVKNVAVEQGTEADELDVSWDAAGSTDEYAVLLAETTGTESADYDEAAVTTSTSATLTGLEHGRKYFVRVVGRNARGDGPLSDEGTETTALPPTEISAIDDTTLRELTLTLDAQDNSDRGGIDIFRSTDGTLGGTVETGLAPTTTTHTDADLLDGTEYDYTARRVTPDAESDSEQVAGTTILPDEDQPTLGNGVKDEIAVDRGEAVSNNGSVRYQLRQSEDAPAWDGAESFKQFIGSFDTLTFEFVGLLDGEEYEIRGRTETDDVTGTWTDPTSIVTQFPGVSDLEVLSTSATSVELGWTDNADNEDGQLIVRERRVDNEWWPERTIKDVGADTESAVDDTTQPGGEYRYRIRAFTPFAEADSETVTAETDDIGLRRQPIPASGWYVEIESPTGDILTPTVLADSQPDPRINDTPRVVVEVPSNERWQDSSLLRRPMRVWRDGTRLPIDRVEEVDHDPETTTIIGRGGTALDEIVDRDVDDLVETHDFIADVLDEAGIAHTVDTPDSSADDVSILGAPTINSLRDAFKQIDGTSGNTVPVRADIDNGSFDLQQVGWARSARFAGVTDAPIDDLDPEPETYWRDRAYALESSGDRIAWSFESGYDWPAEDAAVFIRLHAPADEHPAFEVSIDDTTVDSFPEDSLSVNSNPGWSGFFATEADFEDVTISDSFDVAIEATSASDGKVVVDGGGCRHGEYEDDVRFSETSINADGELEGLWLFPEQLQLTTEDFDTIEQVIGGSISVDIDNTEGSQALSISNDGGETWVEGPNTEEFVGTFDTGSTQIRGRVTLSRYDDGSVFGAGQRLSDFSLTASLDDTPFIESEAFEDSISSLLQTFADRQDFIWEVQPGDRGESEVIVTQAGQRETTLDPSVVDYGVQTDASQLVETVIAYGPSRQRRDERVVLDAVAYVGVGDGYLQPGSIRVFDPSTDPETVYTQGEDYQVLFNEGSIRRVEGSAIDDGEEVGIDYDTKRRAEYTLPGADGTGDTIRETVTNAVTQQALAQSALFAAKRLAEPQVTVDATIATDRTGFNLVDALSLIDVPSDEPLAVSDVEVGRAEINLTLGAGESASDVFSQIDRRFSGLAERL